MARLRGAVDRYHDDARLQSLVAELRAGSHDFVRIWDTDPVRTPGHRTKTTEHPDVGTLQLDCDVLMVPEDDQQVVLITARAGSTSAQALHRLAAEPERNVVEQPKGCRSPF